MLSRRRSRLALAFVVVGATAVLLTGYLGGGATGIGEEASVEGAIRSGADDPVVEPRDDVTVITTDSNVVVTDESDGPRGRAEIVAFAPDGSVLYYNDSHTRYWDVDPVAGTRYTVEYVAADHVSEAACHAATVCTRNVVERVNLSTGDVERVYDRVTPGKHSTRWHDVDRIDDSHLAVADIYRDRVFVVDTASGLETWAWNALADYPRSGGGPFPDDWTHVNDVEVLPDGRLMASLRNQDQVVFLDRETGLDENWTLGSDGDHETLYEQHNPDFIPPADGGPAVLVADSENRRVVEYQRRAGAWERTWEWRDAAVQWPRDADRLPGGNTLITDSNGNRVLEVDADGEVVWHVDIGFPYEAERLGTGPESANGPSAASADLASRTTDPEDVQGTTSAWLGVRRVLPSKLVNAVTYVLPVWMGGRELAALLALVVGLVAWVAAEWRWADVNVSLDWPITVRRR